MTIKQIIPTLRRLSTTAAAPRDSQTFSLPDGRTLGYAEYGTPTGFPLLYFHGYPSCRLSAGAADALARDHDLRLLSLDRPGFGLSTFQPNRRIVDWPADVLAFADHAGLGRFAVLGGSGGGPYAVACAASLPRDRLAAAGVMAGGPPWVAGAHYMYPSARALRWFARYFPSLLRVSTDGLVGSVKWVSGTKLGQRWTDDLLERLRREARAAEKEGGSGSPEKEAAAGKDGRTAKERREMLLRELFEPFAQGSRGFVQETRLLTKDWGFAFEDVTYPVKLWHGRQDKNAPIEMIRYMTERMPNCTLREYDTGHFDMGPLLREILEELVTEETRRG
ncbi:alpha/beta-hydrolase [Calocera viscosa TUFC12733]|uniref:Alpha/beta-hydrolase n=1 Tax=Calocera viscosa (strain TUFC12733) TaxID=1330018 RepID=A0A167NB36_CALVF|nr:alpha/beta-hydrolase [Calocera viscosa TUFC12733]